MQLSLLTVVTMSLVLVSASAQCTSDGSQCCDWGDCKHQPTICGRQSANVVGMRPGNVVSGRRLPGNVVDCHYIAPSHDEPSLLPAVYADEARGCFNKRCSDEVENDFPEWCRDLDRWEMDTIRRFGGYIGWCHGNDCLNLNFYCAEGEYCEMNCDGGDSCEGLTLRCADNQVCLLKYGGKGEVKCGEGTVAKSVGPDYRGCVLADTADDCDQPIEVCDESSRRLFAWSGGRGCEPATCAASSNTRFNNWVKDTDGAVYKGNTCDWIMEGGSERNTVNKCTMSSKLGKVYDLCPVTCAKLGFGPCATKNQKVNPRDNDGH